MNITFIGVGNVGGAIADNLQKLGYKVTIAARDPQSKSVQAAVSRNSALIVQSPKDAVSSADVVFLATPFSAIESALAEVKGALDNKIVVDCTNPVGANLSHGLESKISGGEKVQQIIPNAHVVKAFTIYGYENFEDSNYPGYGDLKPAMLVAGNNQSAKETVAELCRQIGWEPVDIGDISLSLHLEHMTLLWIKMARVQGRGAGFVWAMLNR
ncbi:MAG TPA: NADPH-dependent F420 reductase [Oculatellaceae cyanobacterium]|jgi:predicted dinucleotide-binding enzyme